MTQFKVKVGTDAKLIVTVGRMFRLDCLRSVAFLGVDDGVDPFFVSNSQTENLKAAAISESRPIIRKTGGR